MFSIGNLIYRPDTHFSSGIEIRLVVVFLDSLLLRLRVFRRHADSESVTRVQKVFAKFREVDLDDEHSKRTCTIWLIRRNTEYVDSRQF